jgi:hypothetical protein
MGRKLQTLQAPNIESNLKHNTNFTHQMSDNLFSKSIIAFDYSFQQASDYDRVKTDIVEKKPNNKTDLETNELWV